MNLTVKQFAKKMQVSENKLRYYEKQGLLVPKRDTNNYRLYTDDDVVSMQYILVMRYAQFSIKEIKEMMQLLNQPLSKDCNFQSNNLFEQKINSLEKMIQTYQDILSLMKQVPISDDFDMVEKNYNAIKDDTNNFITMIFEKMIKES